MSHFTVLVITNQIRRRSQETFERNIQTLLEPYYEGKCVPEYDRPCNCIGNIARENIRGSSDRIYGSWDTLRTLFYKKFDQKPSKPFSEMTDEEAWTHQDVRDKAWTELTKDKKLFEKTAFDIHLLRNNPNPNCDVCKGKGTYRSTYNPKSKWDWFNIGGRWSGECHEDGLNIFRVKELIGSTFAVVTPDGEWHERGKMGWWAVVSNEKEGWDEEFKKLVAQYGDNYAVLVDCHI